MRKCHSRIALLLSGVILLAVDGCTSDPKKILRPKPPPYGDRTQTEHCIQNLVQAYEDADIERIEELFHAEYIFVYQPDDVPAGQQPYVDRARDIQITNNMFLATKGQFTPAVEELSLDIDPGAWVEISEVAGQPCDDCWETERNYTLEVVLGETTYLANDIVKFIVIPVDEDGTARYKIRIIYDIPEN